MAEEKWVTMSAAAKKLGIPANRISRWAGKGIIEVRPHHADKRLRLVNLIEVEATLKSLNDTGIEDDDNDGANKNKENGKADP